MAESEKDQIIRKLKAENKGLQEQIAYLRRKLFDHKSEVLNPNQTSLFEKENSVFNEPEQT
ncbi:transposase [Lactiplantibacillus plantarum]|nr:transposase [Lactiplantibacillus plantarum]MCW6149376.1 transposase [Lactiplantibacillus plantarum]